MIIKSEQAMIWSSGGQGTGEIKTNPWKISVTIGNNLTQYLPNTSQASISIVKPTRYINVSNLFYWSNTLHVLDSLSIHHQELKTVHTATGIWQTDTADCLLAGTRRTSIFFPLAKQSAVSVWHTPVAVCIVFNSWWWTERLSETCRVLLQ